ncbi:hypothetical protein MIR68_002221 [Amoeboaphelidium protococcarum]|nr:hypothetical protein MIR68_002221 [Amoeboaphelidium protococcarum]
MTVASYQFQKSQTPQTRTVSIAFPSSILDNAQSPDLKTYLIGQIARSMVIFKVDEVIAFQQESSKGQSEKREGDQHNDDDGGEEFSPSSSKRFNSQTFMTHVLRYLETPQYLRKSLFPHHPNLKFAGLLNPIDAPHHLRKTELSEYREGLVIKVDQAKSQVEVDCGFDKHVMVKVDPLLIENIKQNQRVTLKLSDPQAALDKYCHNQHHHHSGGGNSSSSHDSPQQKKLKMMKACRKLKVSIVSPRIPTQSGSYWGYEVRQAGSFSDVFKSCPYDGGYDMTIGTSERGDDMLSNQTVRDALQSKYADAKHLLIVFGGLLGIEVCVEGDQDLMESTSINPEDSRDLFDFWLNTCPDQGSRTIRSEEAILITMSALKSILN